MNVGNVSGPHARQHLPRRIPAQRMLPGEQFEREHAQRPHVGARVDRIAARLLGAHVQRRADDRPGHREPGVLQRDGVCCLARGPLVGRKAPVDDDDLAEAADHDVRRLEVPVHDATFVRVADGLTYGGEPLEPGIDVGFFPQCPRPTADELHRVVRPSIG